VTWENKVHWVRDVTYDEDRSQIASALASQLWPLHATPPSAGSAWPGFTNIAAANHHHHAGDSNRPMNLFGIT
jgi:hypothetical protein